jgi:hypothetical protein
MTHTMSIEELLNRACDFGEGTEVVNCVIHMAKPLTERPIGCGLCSVDVQSALKRALAEKAWLKLWKDDAIVLLGALRDEPPT